MARIAPTTVSKFTRQAVLRWSRHQKNLQGDSQRGKSNTSNTNVTWRSLIRVFRATVVYDSDSMRPIGRWKEAWESAKVRAGVSCRFHDLRHTGCTRMLEAGVPFSVVATIMGWSPSTMVRMTRRYGHIGQAAQRQAVDTLNRAGFQDNGAQNWVHPT